MANKDASDFMLEEFEQIAKAYFSLQDHLTQWFRVYLSLVAVPLTATGIILQITKQSSAVLPTLTSLPQLVAGLFVVIGMLGVFILVAIISTRNEMLMYARTINQVRGYFAALDDGGKNTPRLYDHLVLPFKDDFPPFFEAWRTVFFMTVMIGALDGAITGLGFVNLGIVNMCWFVPPWSYVCSIGFVVISTLFHLSIYWIAANRRENEWKDQESAIPAYRHAPMTEELDS